MDEAGWEAFAYEQIGRIIVAWGQLDQAITSQTWKLNNPSSSFPAGPIEATFYKRWCTWCAKCEPFCAPKSRSAFHAFREHVESLSTRRDDLAHNTFKVAGITENFFVGVARGPRADWRERFERWASKYAHRKAHRRPLPPPGNTTYPAIYKDEAAWLLAEILDATATIARIRDEIDRGMKFAVPPRRSNPHVITNRFQTIR